MSVEDLTPFYGYGVLLYLDSIPFFSIWDLISQWGAFPNWKQKYHRVFLSLGNGDILTLLSLFLQFYFWKELWKHALLSVTSASKANKVFMNKDWVCVAPAVLSWSHWEIVIYFADRNSGLCCTENSHKLRQGNVSNSNLQAFSSENTRFPGILLRVEWSTAPQRQERESIVIPPPPRHSPSEVWYCCGGGIVP